jgi:hypothetical protein
MRPSPRFTRGQSILEFAISFFGLIMFIYVLVNVWMWVNGIMVGRQRAFQTTRLAAGQRGSAGTPVGYARPPIKLVGQATTPSADPPPGWTGIVIGPPPCTAAEPFYEQAILLANEARLLAETQVPPLSAEIEALANQLVAMANNCASQSSKNQASCYAAMAPVQAQLNAKTAELNALEAQIQSLVNQANALVLQGNAACA